MSHLIYLPKILPASRSNKNVIFHPLGIFALSILALKLSVLSWRLKILSNAIHNFTLKGLSTFENKPENGFSPKRASPQKCLLHKNGFSTEDGISPKNGVTPENGFLQKNLKHFCWISRKVIF